MFELGSALFELWEVMNPATLFSGMSSLLIKVILIIPAPMRILLVIALVFFLIRLIPL